MSKQIRVKDLPHMTGKPGPRPFLYCPHCDASYSAEAGDYFMANPEIVMMCDMCDEPLRLVTKQTIYTEVGK